MAPKTGKRKISQQEKNVSLYDPINTDNWKCVVMLAVESSTKDIVLMRKFVEGASLNLRKEVKSLDFECDVMSVLKEFLVGELSFRNGYLLKFSSVFEEAVDCVRKADEKMPVTLTAKIIKAFILMMKKENEDEKMKLAEGKNGRAEIVATDALTSMAGNGQNEKEAAGRKESKGSNKRKPQQKKGSELRGRSILSVKIKQQTPVKEETKLFRRGEPVKGFHMIDDAPRNGYFQLYIVLTGFYDPELALEMIKLDIPLHCVLCLNSTSVKVQQTIFPYQIKMQQTDLDRYWENFLEMLWNPNLTQFFSDVVFQVYSPEALPADNDLKTFMYREMSFLLYDLSDLKFQHDNYLRHMKLWNIDDGSDGTETVPCLIDELDCLPCECITIPHVMQFILDSICGEDYRELPEERELSILKLEDSSETMSNKTVSTGMNRSAASIIPFHRSNVVVPSPKWSSILHDDYKLMLYQKIKSLHIAYHIEGVAESEFGTASDDRVCFVMKRLACKNLDAELKNQSGGLISKLWNNYPIKRNEFQSASSKLLSDIKCPEFILNYCLYALWMSKLERPENVKGESESSPTLQLKNISGANHEANFTITDCSRTVLQKTFRSSLDKEFFSLSRLKIVPKPLVAALSAPEMRTPSDFSSAKRSFVSDFHIPVKYCLGRDVTHYEDLRKLLGESFFHCLEGYDFIEELNKENMVKRIDESALDYDLVHHSYSALTDSIYVIMYNFPTTKGVHRQTYNAMLSTPVGLRDFYDYILDEEREWLEEQKSLLETDRNESQQNSFPNLPDNTSSAFGNFVESDFWHENSIKYALHRKSILDGMLGKVESQRNQKIPKQDKTNGKSEKEELPAKKDPTQPQLEEPYDFIGFDLQQGTVQFSGLETVFRGPFNSSVKVTLQERLYGSQELGIHIRQGGHILHLYSYVCPEPHTEQPYVCHIEHKKGIILAFSRSTLETATEIKERFPLKSNFMENDVRKENICEKANEMMQNFPTIIEDNNFANIDMKLSLPNSLTVAAIRKHFYPCYIKQCYLVKNKNSPLLVQNEKNRLFLPNGSIVKIMTDNTVEVLNMDTSIVTTSLDDFVLGASRYSSEDEFGTDDMEIEEKCTIQSFTETKSNGFHYSVVNGKIQSIHRFQIVSNVDVASQTKYSKRMDFTNYVLLSNGTFSIEFKDGSKITTSVYEEEWLVEIDFDEEGKSTTFELYIAINMEIVMEHPRYATTVYDSKTNFWRIVLPYESEVKISSTGHYHVDLGGKTEFKINSKEISMWTSNSSGELITNTTADLTVFERNVGRCSVYCTTHDSTGRKFVVHSNANCYVIENEVSNKAENNCENVNSESRKQFVVRRDLTGFEIIHKEHLKRHLNNLNPNVMIHCQRLNTSPITRYFAFLDTTPLKDDANDRLVELITPDAKQKAKMRGSEISSTYAMPPSWTHLFPKRKKILEPPKSLTGRIVLEIQPTDLPDPVLIAENFTFCDISQYPESKFLLTDHVEDILRKVALQDRRMLMDLYNAALRSRINSRWKKSDKSTELKLYLEASAYHVQLREILKNSIRYKIIPKFFDQPVEIVRFIIHDIINSIGTQRKETKIKSDTVRMEPHKGHSGVEYNLQYQSEINFSKVSFRSNLSTDSEPSTSVCPRPPNIPRFRTRSEPTDSMEKHKTERHVFGQHLTP